MIIAANFKSNLTLPKIKNYFCALDSFVKPDDDVYVFPPFFGIQEKAKNFHIGVQNAYCEFNGAFSGEITLESLNDFGIENILIGHSERRNIFGENQELCARKFDFFAKNRFKIFYCIGESLETRKKGKSAIEDFLLSQFDRIDRDYERLIVAYEPIWAIGTGVSAKIEEIEETHNFLRTLTKRPLLYGGSVQLQNISDILKIKNVDGALIGSASLDVENFKKMIEVARGEK